MAISFDSLPVVDLALLSNPSPSPQALSILSQQLHNVFATTGFAYLVNTPLSFSHNEVFDMAQDFFSMNDETKMGLAKQSFVSSNQNTYRGYFPAQPGQSDNLKEGFETGSSWTISSMASRTQQKFNLAETNVWPEESSFPNGRKRMEQLHSELQALSSTLLSLLAVSLGRDPHFFASYLFDSLSTLRLLHYPPQPDSQAGDDRDIKLCCTPHTDSGILTLLHQDPTGGLEVCNASGEWIAAPYLPGSIVVNIGDLLAKVSGGRFVATLHRVRTNNGTGVESSRPRGNMGRFSVPFFFEPGEACVVRSIDGDEGILYGVHVRRKMGTWVEFQDRPVEADGTRIDAGSDSARVVSAIA